jgi:hypothetical protein
LSGFIPDKFWRDQKAKLRAILAKPVSPNKDPGVAAWMIRDEVIPFFGSFDKALRDFGLNQHAERSLTDRMETIQKFILEKIAKAHDALDTETRAAPYPRKTVEDDITWTVENEVRTYFEERMPTVGASLKAMWKTDRRLIQALAKRALKKATPEVLAAIERLREDNHWDDNDLHLKYGFYESFGLKTKARSLVKREKVGWDAIKAIDFLYEVFVSNFTQKGLEEQGGLTEFDLYGMKIIVEDATVTPEDTKGYIKYLDEAYHRLRAKKLGDAWYGKVYISCEECGGVNYNTGGGTGGMYMEHSDIVSIFSRPSDFIVELMAHELGHRYWFKSLSSGQRAHFEDLVRAPGQRPVKKPPVKEYEKRAKRYKDSIEAVCTETTQEVKRFERVINLEHLAKFSKNFFDYMGEFYGRIATRVVEFEAAFKDGVTPETKSLRGDLEATAKEVSQKIHDVEILVKDKPSLAEAIRDWIGSVSIDLDLVLGHASVYIDIVTKNIIDAEQAKIDAVMKVWEAEYEKDPRAVLPISDYGKSNVGEAFAEVFAYYVLGKDLNRDQLESFKAVIQ